MCVCGGGGGMGAVETLSYVRFKNECKKLGVWVVSTYEEHKS